MTAASIDAPDAHGEARAGRPPAWLRRLASAYPWRWALWWFAFPNLVILAMWPVGGPVMQDWLRFSGLLAILFNRIRIGWLRRWMVPLLLLGAVYFYVLAVFNLGYFSIVFALELVGDMRPLESPEYAMAGAVLLLCMALAFVEPPKVGRLEGALPIALAGLTVLGVSQADHAINQATHGSYDRAPPPGTPFESAVSLNGITPATLESRNLVIVMVEAMGQPRSEADAAILNSIWDRPEWRDRFEVSHGATRYFGSTTNAEIRELCGRYAQFETFDFAAADCLPKRFAEAGFATHAFHSFTGTFFDRLSWYPDVGFADMRFAERLVADGAGECGGVFAGACDRGVPRIISRTLRGGDERHLVYWLTVNSHLPIVEAPSIGTDRCDFGTARWRRDYPMLCRLYEIERQVSDALTAEIVRGGMAETDILIVGDHNPPFFQRTIRTRFDMGRVPWIYLKAKRAHSTKRDPLAQGRRR